MSKLADELERSRRAIIEDWKARVVGAVTPNADDALIVDTLPDLLHEMAAVLRDVERGVDNLADRAGRVGTQHGSERFRAGFSLQAVVREYAVIRECLFDFIRRNGLPATIDEHDAISRVISNAIVAAVEQFTRERDAAIHRQSAEYFSFVAHELRNPLAVSVLACDILGRHVSAHQARTWQRMQRNLTRLAELIDQTLLETRLRSGGGIQLELHREPVPITELIANVVEDSQDQAQDKAIQLVTNSEDVTVSADRRLLQSMVYNLVRNAIKFSKTGAIVQVRSRAGEGVLSVEVEDECGGLPPGRVEELFTPFVQRGADRTGFGLGLAIVKQAAEAHGGSVQVNDLPGRGCVFMLSLPL